MSVRGKLQTISPLPCLSLFRNLPGAFLGARLTILWNYTHIQILPHPILPLTSLELLGIAQPAIEEGRYFVVL
jgi:hypothetical protein